MWDGAARDRRDAARPTSESSSCGAEGPSFSSRARPPDVDRRGSPGRDVVRSAWRDSTTPTLLDVIATYQDAFSWLRRPEIVITIAAVQGHAIGAGFQLALACDFRVLSEDARFAMLETSLGLVPDLGGTQPLVEAIGYPRALEICVTGRWVDADEARKLGLATIVVDRDDLDGTVVRPRRSGDWRRCTARSRARRRCSAGGDQPRLRRATARRAVGPDRPDPRPGGHVAAAQAGTSRGLSGALHRRRMSRSR